MAAAVWDAVIVGARVAGSVLACHLARRGHRILVLDRATFPSDTLSTHFFDPLTTARLSGLGILDAIERCGAPAIRRARFAAPEAHVEFTGRFAPPLGVAGGYCIRRVTLDAMLVQAARTAGAEVREGARVTDLLWYEGQAGGVRWTDAGGRERAEPAQVVIGADGRYSSVARWVRAPSTATNAAAAPVYYAYFSGMAGPRDTVEVLHGARRTMLVFPTDGELTCVAVTLPQTEAGAYRADHERRFRADLGAIPELAGRLAGAERRGPVRGATDLDGHVRTPIGPGWALVGDAGVHVHPITARGIGLAVRDAELLAEGLAAALEGLRPPEDALAEYQALRDHEAVPAYHRSFAAAATAGAPPSSARITRWRSLAAAPDAASDRAVNGGALDVAVMAPQDEC
ncbi:MAG: NAD(P)/FAD-dependent oxidoreductase [Dehalococcoidia bacterium]